MPLSYVVANWKQYLTYHQATAWLSLHSANSLASDVTTRLIICPSYEVLDAAQKELSGTKTALGAQACSPFDAGAHTGFVGAASLYELGVRYCIVGHSERRMYETQDAHILQLHSLLEYMIIPIICIGEDAQTYQAGLTIATLERQLTRLLIYLEQHATETLPVLIAYEPIYAIGTGVIPSIAHLSMVFAWLGQTVAPYSKISGSYLYGGSVTPETAQELLTIKGLHGFLLGKAGTDFQALKKIVSLIENRR